MNISDTSKIFEKLCCRSTKVRFGIVNIFHQTKKPISALEILNILKDKHAISANKTTVYRQLDFLESKNIVRAIQIEGTKHYQLNDKHPHQVLVCSICHDIIPIDHKIQVNQADQETIAKKHNFNINHYSLLFFGSCQKCQQSTKIN